MVYVSLVSSQQKPLLSRTDSGRCLLTLFHLACVCYRVGWCCVLSNKLLEPSFMFKMLSFVVGCCSFSSWHFSQSTVCFDMIWLPSLIMSLGGMMVQYQYHTKLCDTAAFWAITGIAISSLNSFAFRVITSWVEAAVFKMIEMWRRFIVNLGKGENQKSTMVSLVQFFWPLNHPTHVSLTPTHPPSFSFIKLSASFQSPPSVAQQALASVSPIMFCFYSDLFYFSHLSFT